MGNKLQNCWWSSRGIVMEALCILAVWGGAIVASGQNQCRECCCCCWGRLCSTHYARVLIQYTCTQHTGECSTQLLTSSTWCILPAARCSQDRGALHYCGQQVVHCTGAGQSKGGDGTLGGDNEEAGFNIIPPSSSQPTNPTTPAANALPSFSSSSTFGLQSGQSKKLSAVFWTNQSLCANFFIKLPFLDCSLW